MRRLYEVNVSLAGSPPFEAALDEILSAAMVFTGTDRGTIQLVTPDGEHAEIARAFGFPPESGFLDLFRAHRSQLGCAAFGRDRQRIIVEDVTTFTGLADTEEGALWLACGVLAAQSTPLISRQGEYVGVLSTQYRQPHRPSEDELKMIDLLAWTAAEFITRHRADEALRTSEERFRSFADASSDVLWIVDAQTRHLEYLSPAYEQVWGEPRETVMRDMSHWISRLHPEDAAAAGEGIERLLTGESYSTEYRIVRPDGAVRFIHDTGFPIYQDGRIVRVAGVAQDLTERRLAERALAASELRLRSLVEGLPQLVWRAAGNGSWTWASPQWTAFTGQAEPACHGEGWLESLHPDDRGAAASAWKPLGSSGEFELECRIRRAADGEYRWFKTQAVPVRNEAGVITEWLGTSTDIHDLRQLHHHQQILLGELQHRVRNTLGVIRSIARRSAETAADKDELASHLQGRLGAFSRVQAAVTRTPAGGVDLAALIEDELVAHAARESEALSVVGPPLFLKPRSAESLSLAIHELVTNAVKYGALSGEGGRLSIRWMMEEPDGVALLRLVWEECGVDLPAGGPARRGFGMELLERSLPYELDARTQAEFRPTGFRFTMEVPLAALVGE
jgi:PAS domain S-box-containing protein